MAALGVGYKVTTLNLGLMSSGAKTTKVVAPESSVTVRFPVVFPDLDINSSLASNVVVPSTVVVPLSVKTSEVNRPLTYPKTVTVKLEVSNVEDETIFIVSATAKRVATPSTSHSL